MIVPSQGLQVYSPNDSHDVRQQKLIAFTDQLTRVMAQALLDKSAGK